MKVNLEIVPVPMMSGFTMFAKVDGNLLKKTKQITIEARMETKTRVSTSFYIGEACNTINFPIEGFKTFEKTEWNYFSGKNNTSNYFVLSKKQNREVYIEYLKKLVEMVITEYFKIEMDEVTILLREPKF